MARRFAYDEFTLAQLPNWRVAAIRLFWDLPALGKQMLS